MFGRVVERVFDEIPIQALNSEASVCFLLDEQLRLTFCNRAWDRFAIENGAPQLSGARILGKCVLDSIDGELAGYYESMYKRAFATGEVQEQDFHCSSATLDRLMIMRVHRLRSAPALLAVCSKRIEQAHTEPSSPALETAYRNRDGVIVMCSNCRRTRQAGDSAAWDWVPDFVEQMPQAVSHGLCGLCVEYYRWGLQPRRAGGPI